MAQSPDVSVARALFISALLRSEQGVQEISRDDATLFARSILRTCNVCTTSNVKLCKSYIVKYVLVSQPRTAALSKYLITLSKSFSPRAPDVRLDTTKPGDENEGLGKIVNGKVQQQPEPAFKRLHILYVVHDFLSYIHSHLEMSGHSVQFYPREALEQVHPAVSTLAELAVCGCDGKATKTSSLVLDLLAFWRENHFLAPEQLDETRDKVSLAEETGWDVLLERQANSEASKASDERRERDNGAKWLVPRQHSVIDDPTAPWHELPAANGLYMRRTRGYPLRASNLPAGGFSLKNGGKEADPKLKQDVSNLYNEVIRCYDKYTNADEVHDVDALGNIIWKDPERSTRNYWGFTLDGIERRKELANHFAETADGYGNYGQDYEPVQPVDDAVERARIIATARGRGMGRGRGRGVGGHSGWRGGRNW